MSLGEVFAYSWLFMTAIQITFVALMLKYGEVTE